MRPKWRLLLTIVVVFFGISIWWLLGQNQRDVPTNIVSFDNIEVVAEVADDQVARTRGLSGRESLPADEGMLFIFDDERFYEFHMLDMNFAIDIIWIDENLGVVDITHSLPPESYPDRVTSKQPARYILEVNAGFAERHEIGVGDRVSIDF